MRGFFAGLFCISFSANAEIVLVSNDGPYFSSGGSDNYKYIYSKEYIGLIPSLIKKQASIQNIYEKSFDWKLDEKTSLVLASNNNQIANAFATVYPNNLNFFYNGGAALYDEFANKSWLFTLLTHEGAHLYQLNAKQGLSSYYHKFLGNSVGPHVLGFIPVFVSPNFLLPTWLIEGNAVLNESRFGNGGRLYSGEERALFYALIRSGKLDEARLTNDHLEFPFGREKYNVGAEFNLFLAEKFGVDKVNQFFFTHSTHYINPFIVNSSFKSHFGEDYSSLISQFLSESEKKAKNQKVAISPRELEAPFIGPMNSDDDKIYFVSSNGKGDTRLNIFSKHDKKNSSLRKDLPLGKVFELSNNTFVAVSSGYTDLTHFQYSLWDESKKDVYAYRGKIVLDKKQNDLLWLNPKESMDEPQLYFNDKKIGTIHSSALLDKNGHAYYFKQVKNQRTLFKDEIPLFSFNGHYGKLVDIDEKENPFFIASTSYGSSLFSYQNGKILRLLDSDVVVDARKISEGDFLVREITSEGYEVKVLRIYPREERPVLYSYSFEKNPEQNLYENLSSLPDDVTELTGNPYSLIKDMRFGGVTSNIFYSGSSLALDFKAIWADPLYWNNIYAQYKRNEYSGVDDYELTYYNSKNLLKWYVDYTRKEYYQGNDGVLRIRNHNHDDRTEIGALLPFYKNGIWEMSIEEALSYRSLRESAVNYASLVMTGQKNQRLEFYPYKKIELKIEDERGDDKLVSSDVIIESSYSLPYDLFIRSYGIYKRSNEDELFLDTGIRKTGSEILSRGYSLWGPIHQYKNGGRFSFELGQFFESGIYYAKFPISLRRIAPKFIFSHFYYAQGKKGDFQERGVALDSEFLFFHLLPARITFATLRKESDAAEFTMQIQTQASF